MHGSAPHATDARLRQVIFDPPFEDWPDAGAYQLWIRLCRDARVTVGRLGRLLFPAGVYVYTGRASRALRARVLRHIEGGKNKHWHIDYLLAHQQAQVLRVGFASVDPEAECELNQSIGGCCRRSRSARIRRFRWFWGLSGLVRKLEAE